MLQAFCLFLLWVIVGSLICFPSSIACLDWYGFGFMTHKTEDCSIAIIWLIINFLVFFIFLFSPQIEEGRPLPSPSHLKRKIIIKNKKLKPEQEMEGEKLILFRYISYWEEKNYFLLYCDKYKYLNLSFSRP